jgi:hypothetical protein
MCSGRNNFRAEETILGELRRRPETITASFGCIDQQWSSRMLAIFGIIYREFCKARLAEMRLVAGY